MGVVKGAEDPLDLEEATLVFPEIDRVATLEIDLDEDQSLIVLALNGFETAAAP